MALRNVLIEGVSGTGKTSVCRELQRRGFFAVNGDTELAYTGDPVTGEPIQGGGSHENHLWPVDRVRAIAARTDEPVAFFCGGSRNFPQFIDVFDVVLVLDVDADTLVERLARRPDDEWGSKPAERDLAVRLLRTREDVPADGIVIDATAPLVQVVDEIVRLSRGSGDDRR